ncbi:hypothetical protein GQ457_10G014090 [Hibiscus cannabinus]
MMRHCASRIHFSVLDSTPYLENARPREFTSLHLIPLLMLRTLDDNNIILADRSCTEATLSTRTQNMSRQITNRESLPRAEERKIRNGFASERRPRIVKVKDLKPKRIKDYLEYKFSQRRRYPSDNDYKEVTVLPSRDIVYDRVKQLIRLRHKPITQQDALPRSDSQPRFSAKAGPVVSVRDIPFVILLKQNIEAPP